MKYRLAKDLPFAKKGDEVYFNKNNCCFEVRISRGYYNIGEYIFLGWSNLNCLLEERWVEEVKPREIWLNQYADDTNFEFSFPYQSKEEAQKNALESVVKQVKFIEVIDDAD